MPDPFPPMYAIGYLNQPSVMKALGAKVNYTDSTTTVENGKSSSVCSLLGYFSALSSNSASSSN